MRRLLLMFYANAGPKRLHPKSQKTHEQPIDVCFGGVNDVLTGLTGLFVIHCVIFLQTPQLNRKQFVQTFGILFTFSTPTLRLALRSYGKLTLSLELLSGLWLQPVAVGMIIRSSMRHFLAAMQF